VLSNWTISKCMSDPATTEITGPTIVNRPTGSGLLVLLVDRRHVVNASVVVRTPEFQNNVMRAGVRRLAAVADRAVQSEPLEHHDRRRQRADGMGGQRGVQMLDDPVRDRRIRRRT
jgi:hypothetical protein